MTEILIILGIGIIGGIIIRGKKQTVILIEKAIIWSIYLLLFLLGISIGSEEKIMNNLGDIGFTALIITLGSLAACMVLSLLLWKFYFRKAK